MLKHRRNVAHVKFCKSRENASKFQEDLSLNESAKTAFYCSCHHPLNSSRIMTNDGEYLRLSYVSHSRSLCRRKDIKRGPLVSQ